ncbi:hypothetical protein [Williamsia serinedens]|uniref:Uncharacterized protein n=1 Tax=Williamsia serinedens TaxID=391736 RepID=A0ABT1H688_9NOCA|nr:hypothetical protein [Williamsia serinedens]MCP2162740.1 hypothetical protein [Williamsia serinedens]
MSAPGGSGAAALLDRVADLLGASSEVLRGDDGVSATVSFDGTRAALQAMSLADGLDVLSLTQVLAWDLPNTEALRDDIDRLAGETSFGSIKRSSVDGVTTDVLQSYTFPAGGLGDAALITMVTLVLSIGADLSRRLTD